MQMNISENLKKAREKSNFSQNSLAEKIGVAKNTYIGWERGANPPPADKLALLAETLAVPVSELLYGEKAGISQGVQDLLRRLEALPQDLQGLGMLMLRSILFGLENAKLQGKIA